MKNIFDLETTKEIINRINNLSRSTERLWGKMEVGQMLAHCTSSLQLATGERKPNKAFLLLGKTVGTFFKSTYYSDKPFKKNAPTTKQSKIIDERDFYREKEILISKIIHLTEDKDICENQPHPYFGNLTSQQWGTGIYKHLDHHLRQFYV